MQKMWDMYYSSRRNALKEFTNRCHVFRKIELEWLYLLQILLLCRSELQKTKIQWKIGLTKLVIFFCSCVIEVNLDFQLSKTRLMGCVWAQKNILQMILTNSQRRYPYSQIGQWNRYFSLIVTFYLYFNRCVLKFKIHSKRNILCRTTIALSESVTLSAGKLGVDDLKIVGPTSLDQPTENTTEWSAALCTPTLATERKIRLRLKVSFSVLGRTFTRIVVWQSDSALCYTFEEQSILLRNVFTLA